MDDPTLPRMPVVVAAADVVSVKTRPICEFCGTEVPDLTDPKQHVCMPDPAGAVKTPLGNFTKTTLDVSTAAFEKDAEQARAAEAAAAAAAPPDAGP